MNYKIGDNVKIGMDAGIVKNIYTSKSGNLVELQMVKNSFGQGRHEIITQDTADNLIEPCTNVNMLIDIEKRITVILGLLHENLPLEKEEIEKSVLFALRNFKDEH